jgi:hypothetical protein
MKRLLTVFVAQAIFVSFAHAQNPKVEVAFAKDKDSKPTTSFAADVAKVYAFFKTTGIKNGDTVRGVFIAEDVGDAAPKETKIDESSLTADKADFSGAFSLSKPTNGWPVGSYRVEIYLGDKLATTGKFTIGTKSGDDDEDDDDDDKDDAKG